MVPEHSALSERYETVEPAWSFGKFWESQALGDEASRDHIRVPDRRHFVHAPLLAKAESNCAYVLSNLDVEYIYSNREGTIREEYRIDGNRLQLILLQTRLKAKK